MHISTYVLHCNGLISVYNSNFVLVYWFHVIKYIFFRKIWKIYGFVFNLTIEKNNLSKW